MSLEWNDPARSPQQSSFFEISIRRIIPATESNKGGLMATVSFSTTL